MAAPANAAAAPAPRPATLILWVTVPFGLCYFASYLFRTVNAIIAPQLTAEIGLTAADLGLLTSLYFVVFAGFQLPLGVLLDQYGPRRVQAALFLVGAAGAALFAVGQDFVVLAIGRCLIGLGVSAGLMAALQANVTWWPRERLALVNGVVAAFGSMGALVSTVPVEMLVRLVGWRGVFVTLTALTLLCAVLVWMAVPERAAAPAERRRGGFRAQLAELGEIYGSAYFWRLCVVVLVHNATFLSYQSLWTGSWLRDVAGLDRLGVANGLLMFNLGMFAGVLILGLAADRLHKVGIRPLVTVAVGIVLSIAVQAVFALGVTVVPMTLCFAFGFFGSSSLLIYAVYGQHFPRHLIGRVNTAQNMLIFFAAFAAQWEIGAIIDLWPQAAEGHYHPEAQTTAMWVMIALEVAAFLWFLWPRKGSH